MEAPIVTELMKKVWMVVASSRVKEEETMQNEFLKDHQQKKEEEFLMGS